jgi:urease accessory protein UreH
MTDSFDLNTLHSDSSVPPSIQCTCPCACVCWPVCKPSPVIPVNPTAHLRVVYSSSRHVSEATILFGTYPCKLLQPRMHAYYTSSHGNDRTGGVPANAASIAAEITTTTVTHAIVPGPFSNDPRSVSWFGACPPAAFIPPSMLSAGVESKESIVDRACVVYLSSFGGGVCARDQVSVHIEVESNATAVLLTQGFTKVFAPTYEQLLKQRNAAEMIAQGKKLNESVPDRASQSLYACIEQDGLLLWLPDATLLHAGASFQAPSFIELKDGITPYGNAPTASIGSSSPIGSSRASIVHLEWLHGGREARGELFDFESYRTRLHVHHVAADGITKTPILHEALTLERLRGEGEFDYTSSTAASSTAAPAVGQSSLARRLAPYVTFCTVVLLGARVEKLARAIQTHVDAWHLRKQPRVRHVNGHLQSQQQQQQPPAVLVSCTWIDVPLTAPSIPLPGVDSPTSSSSAAATASASAPVPLSTHCRGCILRLAGTSLEPVQAMLALYLQSLQSTILVTPPWR